MSNLKWNLFSIRTQIEMRMNQLDLSRRFRGKIAAIIKTVTDIPRLTRFASRLETRDPQKTRD